MLPCLQRDLGADCVFYAIVHVGVNPTPEGIKTLIAYLDYQYPDPKSPYGFGRTSMYPFPAVPELVGTGTLVVPAVLEAIANPATPPARAKWRHSCDISDESTRQARSSAGLEASEQS
jgi:hypothetical protein